MPSAVITKHRIFMSSHLITQLIKKYVSKINHLIIVIAKKVGIPTVSAQIEQRCSNFHPGFFGAVAFKFGESAVIIKVLL